ncbi:MAG TPA: hypothetical protein VF980_16400 [Thermoanaerobaculia bacterium]
MKWAVTTATIAALLYGTFVFFVWKARDRDVSRFIVLSAQSVDEKQVPSGVTVSHKVGGYDGTAFYRLALNPFTRQRTEFGITLDAPPYRQQRILYPLLVWLLAAGHVSLVPWLLVAVNIAAVACLGGAGSILAVRIGQHPLWGLLFALYPGFVYSVSRDLCEPLACAFGIAAMAAAASRRPWTAGALLTAAILTRETFVLLALAYGAAYLWSRFRYGAPPAAAAVFSIPLACFVIWQLVLRMIWGVTPLIAGARSLTFPFAKYWSDVVAASSLRHEHRLHFTELAFLALLTVLALMSFWAGSVALSWRLAFVGYLALAATMPQESWSDDAAYMRVLGDYSVVSIAAVLHSRAAPRFILAAATAAVWYYLASHLVEFT